MVKTGFKDPAEIKKQDPKDHPVDGKKSPWDFTCPQYDERSSCFVNAGTKYGVGHKQPVGSEQHNSNPAVPFGRVNTLKVDEV
jgi:hypothetical protein